MAYANFVPKFWAEHIERENEAFKVYAALTNRKWEGTIKKKGDTVNILGIGHPTIKDYTKVDIDAPEVLDDLVTQLIINKAKYFNVAIDDIDKRQAVGGVMTDIMAECSEGLAVQEDMDVSAVMVAGAGNTPIPAADLTPANIRGFLYQARTELYKQGVGKGAEICCVMSPKFHELLAQAVEGIDTDNSKVVKNGYVGKSAGISLYMSNIVPLGTGGTPPEKIVVLTRRATAHASQINDVEPYRMEKRFSDAVKGLLVYGSKVVRPKEIVVLDATYAA